MLRYASALRRRLGDYDPTAIDSELGRIQVDIDDMAFDLYGISETDRAAVGLNPTPKNQGADNDTDVDNEDDDGSAPVDSPVNLLSWALGVGFGRFDWRLATGEREIPPEPDAFDPLPARSPGMLPDSAEPFCGHSGILVDDPGHPHDLARLIEDVLARVEMGAPGDLRRWLQNDFFPLHVKMYSKSRRKAPIYWQLATSSTNYSVWLYIHGFTKDTLFRVQNDYVAPKLAHEERLLESLKSLGDGGTTGQRKEMAAQEAFVDELRVSVSPKMLFSSEAPSAAPVSSVIRARSAYVSLSLPSISSMATSVKRFLSTFRAICFTAGGR